MIFVGRYVRIDGEKYVRLSDYEACLDHQPIYDVEAVVRELEELADGFSEISLDEAIEIVRRGGSHD